MSKNVKTIKDYIDIYNKSVTSSVSNAQDTKVTDLRNLVLDNSKILQTLNNSRLVSGTTEIPFVPITDSLSKDIVLGGLSVGKKLINTTVTLADETWEDSEPNLETSLDNILTSFTTFRLEKFISNEFKKVTKTTGISTDKNFSTILELLKKFNTSMWAMQGPFVAAMSYNTYLDVINTLGTGGKMLLQESKLKLVPLSNMDDDLLAVFHSHGIGFGYNINGIEEDRKGSKNATDLILQLEAGFAFDDNYIKTIALV